MRSEKRQETKKKQQAKPRHPSLPVSCTVSNIMNQFGGAMGAGYPDEVEVVVEVEGSTGKTGVDSVPAAVAGVTGVSKETSPLSTALSASWALASYRGVASPATTAGVPGMPAPLTMPRPGIIGVFKELVDVLPFAPKGKLLSKAPLRELLEVFGRLVVALKLPQPLPWWELLAAPAVAWPFGPSWSSSTPESFHGLR